MFNLMFGPTEYKRPVAILGGVDHERIGRFRDLWVEQPLPDQFVIAIYTRTGGNNRADYRGLDRLRPLAPDLHRGRG